MKELLHQGAYETGEEAAFVILQKFGIISEKNKDFDHYDSNQHYCLCKKKWDGISSMIECDICGEWFHFDCVDISTAPKYWTCVACKRIK